MNLLLILGLAVAATSISGCGPVVMGQRLSKKNVCPSADTSKCVQSIGNVTPIVVQKKNRFIPVAGGNAPDYWFYLGRMSTPDASPVSNFCGNVTVNPFKTYQDAARAVSVLGAPVIDSPFYFNRKASDRKALESAIDIAKVLNLAGVPTGTPGREHAEARLKAMASRTANSNIKMEGTYYFVHLNPGVVASLFANDTPAQLKACRDYLQGQNRSIITGLTGVLIRSLHVENTTQTKIETDLKAALNGVLSEDKIANIGLQWKREVDDVFRSETKPVFQVLSVSSQRIDQMAAANAG